MCVNYDNPLLIQAPLSFVSWSGNKKDVSSIKLIYDFSKEASEYYVEKTKKKAEEKLRSAADNVSADQAAAAAADTQTADTQTAEGGDK